MPADFNNVKTVPKFREVIEHRWIQCLTMNNLER